MSEEAASSSINPIHCSPTTHPVLVVWIDQATHPVAIARQVRLEPLDVLAEDQRLLVANYVDRLADFGLDRAVLLSEVQERDLHRVRLRAERPRVKRRRIVRKSTAPGGFKLQSQRRVRLRGLRWGFAS